MDELLKDWIGTIAVLIYLLYPLLKRLFGRRKERRKRKAPAGPAGPRQPEPASTRPRPPPTLEPIVEAPERPEVEIARSTQDAAGRLRSQATSLLERAEADPRLARLIPALRDDLLGGLQAIDASLRGQPSMSTVLDDAARLEALSELFRYMGSMADQRTRPSGSMLGDADKMADACYRPVLEFARSHGLDLRTSTPIVVTGNWPLSIAPRFAATRIAPLRVPRDFGRSVWLWPAIAHEVAHDLYYSVDHLEAGVHESLGLPSRVAAPRDDSEIDPVWLRALYGAWLVEVFADVTGTLMLGPAYVETMRRAFRNPDAPHQTAAVFTNGGWIDEHPPRRLRLYMATRVLRRLGRHQEGSDLWERWEAEHAGIAFYFLPLAGRWVGLSDDAMHGVADSVVDALLERAWPELANYGLLSIPGLPYLHAEHAEVERLKARLARGETVDADVRWIMAAAVLAADAQPSSHDRILEAALRSIIGVGEERRSAPVARARRAAPGNIADALVASVRDPEAIREAIILGAALRPYDRPRWR